MLACDFFLVVTATFRRAYVFVLLDIATQEVLHWNVTNHPTADWTVQQFRDGVPPDLAYRFVLHDRDAIFAPVGDGALRSMSPRMVRTPPRAPQSNAYRERFIGTIRRECLHWIILLNDRHVRQALAEWIAHYNRERPHSAVGPELPDAPAHPAVLTGHDLPTGRRVVAQPRVGGLHHHGQLKRVAA